ncbi:MAG: magnesium transporter [Lysobacterales bacterium]|nr:magnesium transporter [Xanthomonadales bacterium]MCB1612990.1 magnesium transporter [Xanthomonadales bacterium]MCP5476347.1 magnesium transporter [Rhodanobacteraceae bacterium]
MSDTVIRPDPLPELIERVRATDLQSAARLLTPYSDTEIAQVLAALSTGQAVEVLEEFPTERRATIAAETAAGPDWLEGHRYPEGSVGRLMERAPAVFFEDTKVGQVIATLRDVVRTKQIVYVFCIDAQRRFTGVVAFRELLYASRTDTLDSAMVRSPFSLRPSTPLPEAMREVVTRHYPVYPVCDEAGHLLGLVRGSVLFEQQAFEISAQAGSMVGVEKEERLGTPWPRALRYRHPWLQLNLLTAFIAGAVVGVFQGTIDRIVLLAVFIPVLSGQCSNTGCQALAVTLRGMTLNEVKPGSALRLISKEAWLGFLNGALVGVVAGIAMFVLATSQKATAPITLSLITFFAMTVSCMVSGMAGAGVPLLLKRVGADPATASSIFLTTATDVFSMGVFLGLAAWLIV